MQIPPHKVFGSLGIGWRCLHAKGSTDRIWLTEVIWAIWVIDFLAILRSWSFWDGENVTFWNGCWWPPTRGWKGHFEIFESPGFFSFQNSYFHIIFHHYTLWSNHHDPIWLEHIFFVHLKGWVGSTTTKRLWTSLSPGGFALLQLWFSRWLGHCTTGTRDTKIFCGERRGPAGGTVGGPAENRKIRWVGSWKLLFIPIIFTPKTSNPVV